LEYRVAVLGTTKHNCKETTLKFLVTVIATVVIGTLVGLGYLYSGAFDAAADQPHSGLVFFLAKTARERSIALRAKDIHVPDLTDPKAIAAGASEYAEMCTGCHLAPGMEDNEIRPGLYPHPPNLSGHVSGNDADPLTVNHSAARQFWIIKHGIKMSAMPAWGKTHDDATIWTMVAFLQKLPTLTPEQYAEMTQESESAHEASGHGSTHAAHDHDAESVHAPEGEHEADSHDQHHH
jgi:mono/diheme cytochrome c family protein